MTMMDRLTTMAADVLPVIMKNPLPLAVSAAVVMVIAITAIGLVRRSRRRKGRPTPPRAMAVIDLARHGATPEIIVRRTGLAHDAVAMILRSPAQATKRQASPRAAAFSSGAASR
jgi:hypothetical protein